ncbi:MAG: hypothetical protein QOC83_4119, partial [Pseudonocardiales bacterium]|nr:hypothetical protein [Pseudonocardiales bacterium]
MTMRFQEGPTGEQARALCVA